MKIPKTTCLLVLISLLAKSYGEEKICKRTKTCQCFNNSDNFEFQCSGNDEGDVLVHIYPNSLIRIDCNNIKVLKTEFLPEVKFENVKKLHIRYCPLPERRIKDIVDHFGMVDLEVLAFEFGALENLTLPTEVFENLSNITTLKLRSNDLKAVGNNFFSNFPKLMSLELDRNNLELHGETFSALSNLKFLSISDNRLQSLDSGIFNNLRNLEKLNLWKNSLKVIESQTFRGLSNLKSLELAFNKIEDIEEPSFNELTKLVNISMRSNRLQKLSRNIFNSNLLLENIEVGGNANLDLQDAVFSNFKFLKHVDLSSSSLKKLPEGVFNKSTSIQIISLNQNELQVLPEDIFEDMTDLKQLSLAYNSIGNLNNNIFSSLKNLEKLDLQHNKLDEINKDLLKPLAKLKELNLSYNNIRRIHLEAFERNKILEKIILDHNKYYYHYEGFYPLSPFNKCRELQELNLSHNEIVDFPEDLMLLVSLRSVDLGWNNISSLRVNALWKVTLNELKIDLEHNNISRLDFTGVEITAIQQPNLDAYHNTGASAVIKISKNPIICDCFAIDFVRYIRNEMYPGVKTAIYFIYDDLQCVFPPIMEGLSVQDITPAMLTCPIGDVIENFKCTDLEKCGCVWRPFDYSLIVDCRHQNLTVIPEVHHPKRLAFNQTIVHLEGNSLVKGPSGVESGYENVSQLFLANNMIDSLRWIPPRIEVLDLHNNDIHSVSYEILQILNSTKLWNLSLSNNPWRCNCEAANLTNYLRQHVHQIDARNVFCEGTNNLLMNLNEKDLCPHSATLLVISTTIVLILCVFTTFAAFYYKFQQEIKVWMYAHNILLFLIKEEELDKDKIYDAFVSYSHKDENFVLEHLITRLESGPQPYKLCLHFRNWIPGEFIATQVTSSVRDSKRTLVVLSPSFLESVWGKMEFRTAHTEAMREGRTRVIIILYGDIDMDSLDDELKAYMKTNTYIKWGDPWFWDKLLYALPHTKIKGVKDKSRKHTNMMKFIDDKFSLVEGKPNGSSENNVSKANLKGNDVKLVLEEDAIIAHEIS